MNITIASNNNHKVDEIKAIIGNYFDNVYTLKDLNITVDIEENGATFVENAIIKAKAICSLTNTIALADDSGIEVEALNGAPGVFSARYSGICGDEANNQLLLKNMLGITNRKANFTSAIALAFPNGDIITSIGKTHGLLLDKPEGAMGFGYDPLFYSTDLNISFGNASPELKNSVSHRYRALISMKQKLESVFNNKLINQE